MTDDTHTLEAGSTFGQHRILRLLGRGGMGEVYEVEHELTGKRHALKLLSSEVMEVPGALERFEREAKVMARLEHPGIVRVDFAGEDSGRHWLRMELMPGREVSGQRVITLEDYVATKGGRLPESEVKALLSEILDALGHAHGKSLVHRDLKPANVLFDGERVKIADFGLVNAAGAEWMDTQVRSTVINQDDEDTLIDGSGTGSRSRAIMGTYAYMSPEQRKGQPADARSDLYAVGLMTFRMLTGMESPGMERASELGLGLDAGWDAWLIGTLKENPDDRFPTASAMQEALDFRSAVSSVALKSEPAPAPESPKVKREPEPLPRPAPARPAAKPRRKQPAAAPVAPAKGSRTWLYWVRTVLFVVFVVGLFAWSPWESGELDYASASGISLDPSEVSAHAERMKENLPAKKPFAVPSIGLEMLWVKPGTFEMGSSSGSSDETPYAVTLTDGYWLGKYEVTQDQWERVTGSNPSIYKGGGRPVDSVAVTEVTSFCDKLTELERKAGRLPAGMAYQLPTEAQWEYACRAGTKTSFSFGDSLTSGQANISGGPGETTDVGDYRANEWGFHDMHGNVWEWCADWYGDYPTGAAHDPVGPTDGSHRVKRGGSWFNSANIARSAYRLRSGPMLRLNGLGFRLSLRPTGKAEPQVQEKARVAVLVKAGTAFTIRDLGLDLLWVKPGTFEMGSPLSEKDREDRETLHTVTLTDGFYLGKHEVTQSQWEKVMGSNPSHFKGGDRPVESVSWTDVTSFCNKLTASERAAGRLPVGMTYQLPTEAQWEYACRAGTKTAFSFGNSLMSRQANISGGRFRDQQNTELDGEGLKIANVTAKRWIEMGPEVATKELQQWNLNGKFEEALTVFELMKAEDKAPMVAFMHLSDDDDLIQLANALCIRDRTLAPRETTDVGKYPENGWGFHDMHGNVWEWCADWYGDYPAGAARDPVGPAVGSYRVGRGGSWISTAYLARSANRYWNVPAGSFFYLGFRLSLRPASK